MGQLVAARGTCVSDGGRTGAVVEAGAGPSNTHDPEPLLLTVPPTSVGQYLRNSLDTVGVCTQGIDDGAAVTSLTVLGDRPR